MLQWLFAFYSCLVPTICPPSVYSQIHPGDDFPQTRFNPAHLRGVSYFFSCCAKLIENWPYNPFKTYFVAAPTTNGIPCVLFEKYCLMEIMTTSIDVQTVQNSHIVEYSYRRHILTILCQATEVHKLDVSADFTVCAY